MNFIYFNVCLNYLYKCEKQGKTPQKDAKINPEIRRKKVSKNWEKIGLKNDQEKARNWTTGEKYEKY